MNNKVKSLIKASIFCPMAIIPTVLVFFTCFFIFIVFRDNHIPRSQEFNIIWPILAVGLVIAVLSVPIILLPAYYIAGKYHLASFKYYALIGLIFGGAFGAVFPNIYWFLLLTACGVSVSTVFWYFAVRRL